MKGKNITEKIDFEQFLNESLKSHGFLFPETDEQMDKFLESVEAEDLPEELNDPMSIFSTQKRELSFNIPLIDNSEAEDNWAIAARGGNEISDTVMEQMKRDREEAERKQK